jgi:Ca2+-binding EF-hand superfamily protein
MTSAISSSTASDWSNTLFNKLDTKKQGYVEKADIEKAFAGTATGTASSADTEAADKFFADVDSDGDGKLTKSELSTAVSKVADELNAQFDQSRVAKGGGAGGPPPGGGAGGPAAGGGGGGGASASADSTSTDTDSYIAAADSNGDGTVSDAEAAAYEATQAAKSAASGTSTSADTASTGVSATSASSGTRVDNGLSKDQLTERLNAVEGNGDTRQSGALKKLVDNFDKADANGDGKLTRAESRDYLKSTREAGQAGGASDADAPGRGPADALAKALELLKAYVNNQSQATASGSSTSNASSISTTA